MNSVICRVIISLFVGMGIALAARAVPATAPPLAQQLGETGTPAPQGTVPALSPMPIPSAPTLSARGYVLMDAHSGYIIASKNADIRMPPASLTKLMTLYLAATALQGGRIHLDDPVRISEDAWRTGGSRMFIQVGSTVPVSDLLQGTVVASGNDATYALAEYVGGNEASFVDLMNKMATTLGMSNTHYTDSNGLPAADHYTTPHDIATLARAWITTFPEYYPWFKQKWFVFNRIKQPNRNRLLWRDPSVDGMKTGHTDDAGFCLVASAERNGMRLIATVMGAPTDEARASETEALLNYGFRFYETHTLYAANVPIVTPRVWLGEKGTVPVGLPQGLYVTTPAGQYQNIKTALVVGRIKAPVAAGQNLGTVTVTLGNQTIISEPLVALEADPRGGLFTRLFDHIAMLFHRGPSV